MKKLFSSNQQSSHIGKTFQVGRYCVTVEDVIAEGEHRVSEGACVTFILLLVTHPLLLPGLQSSE